MVMKGWLETDPSAAIAWAQTPKDSLHESEMAAMAITHSAAGDPQRLVTDLLALPTGDSRIIYCLPDYFNFVRTTTGNFDAAVIYENIPAPLRDAAWPVTIGLLAITNQRGAVDWLNAHINDPGRDNHAIVPLIQRLGVSDPAGTAQWTATLPDTSNGEDHYHPAYVATSSWFEKDPAAAKAWLQTQPPNLRWVRDTLKDIEAKENPNKSQEESTKD